MRHAELLTKEREAAGLGAFALITDFPTISHNQGDQLALDLADEFDG